jgi:adenylate cyclase
VARLVVITLTGVLALTATGMLLFLAGQWFPVALTSLGLSLSAGLTTAYLVQATRRERAALQKILSLQVSPEVAEEIWRRRGELIEQGGLKPQHVTATVMFVDLQGFTPLTEALSSDELMDWLNPIMDLATRIVISHGGMVDDYFGDGIKVNFGVPLPRDSTASVAEDAARALACARELIDEAAALSKHARAPYLLRFGIHTGDVIAASVGSRERQKYTSIGDTVNVAGRLESLAKEISHSTRLKESCVVLSASTVELLADEVPLSYLGPVSLRGRVQPVKAYRLVINQSTAADAVKEIEP